MLYELITGKKENENNEKYYYILEFATKNVKACFSSKLDENKITIFKCLGLKKITRYKSIEFKDPIPRGDIIIEKEDYDFLIKKITGKESKENQEVDIIIKLQKNFFPILMLKSILSEKEIGEMIHFMISKRYFSYQVLYTLSRIIDFSIKKNLSERVYLELVEDIREITELLEDKKWKIISVFISNYQFNNFLKTKNKLFFFFEEVEKIRKKISEDYFKKNNITDLIKKSITNKSDLQLFLSKVQDETLAKSIKLEEVNEISDFISQRKRQRLIEDINFLYNEEDAWKYKLQILKEIILYLIEKNPPYYLINKLYSFSKNADNIFDLVGPFKVAIFLKNYPDESFINRLSPVKKGFIEAFIKGKIKKIGGISTLELQESIKSFKFYLIGSNLFENVYSLL